MKISSYFQQTASSGTTNFVKQKDIKQQPRQYYHNDEKEKGNNVVNDYNLQESISTNTEKKDCLNTQRGSNDESKKSNDGNGDDESKHPVVVILDDDDGDESDCEIIESIPPSTVASSSLGSLERTNDENEIEPLIQKQASNDNGKINPSNDVSNGEKKQQEQQAEIVRHKNPFGCFAFEDDPQKKVKHNNIKVTSKPIPHTKENNRQTSKRPTTSNSATRITNNTKKRKLSTKSTTKTKQNDNNDESSSNLPYHQMTTEQKDKCKSKWQSFADENAPLETKRFQVLIAARLHCQAHESVVRSTMEALKQYIVEQTTAANSANTTNTTNTNNDTATSTSSSKESNQDKEPIYLDAMTLSKANPTEVAKVISSVLFANVKSKQIIKAAYEIKTRFHGIVPESLHGLQMITGIGPKLADVLHHVNSKRHYQT